MKKKPQLRNKMPKQRTRKCNLPSDWLSVLEPKSQRCLLVTMIAVTKKSNSQPCVISATLFYVRTTNKLSCHKRTSVTRPWRSISARSASKSRKAVMPNALFDITTSIYFSVYDYERCWFSTLGPFSFLGTWPGLRNKLSSTLASVSISMCSKRN